MGAELDAVEQFGPYLVYERLGVGGMATVHRALERGIEGFERVVALKRLLPHLAEDASFIKAFVREAKLASLLNHVNIVNIHELGRVGTEYFISMEYIDGRDLRRVLRHARATTGPPPVNIVVGLLLQLCDALDFAHTRNDEHGQPLMLVHRDVSPSNVLVTTAGYVKVIDFGIAKAQSAALRTQTGRVKGKLAYMAPEAIAGRELDARSDLWAVGVIAHELLTTRPLFASKNEYQTLIKVQRGDIMPPSTFNQTVPVELDAIVLKALAREPAERFTDAAELRAELLAMRRTYNLQTSATDVAMWIDWAFAQEVPPDEPVTATGDRRATTHRDEEESVDVAWGGGDPEATGPIVLDDVPDVSVKHYRPVAADVDDDIPPPAPSHGGIFDSQPPRARLETAAGHTPAPTTPASGPRHARMETQTTDPEGQRLRDLLDDDGADAGATVRSLPMSIDEDASQTQPTLPAPPVREPTVRFKAASVPPETQQPAVTVKSVRTKPGYSPARAATATPPPRMLDDDDASATRARGPAVSARLRATRSGPSRLVILIAALFALAAIAAAVTMIVMRSSDRPVEATPAPAPPPQRSPVADVNPAVAATSATIKFVLEPPDAEIWIADQLAHAGAPWSTTLAAGVHHVQIARTGFKTWLTTLELSASESQTLRVVLEPLSDDPAVAEATLTLTSKPAGLEIVLDGVTLSSRTPIKMTIPVGAHTVELRKDGIVMWSHELVAMAAANYEFSPNLNANKRRRSPTPAPAP